MGYFLHFSSLYAAPYIELYVLAYLDFIFEFQSSFNSVQNGQLWPDT